MLLFINEVEIQDETTLVENKVSKDGFLIVLHYLYLQSKTLGSVVASSVQMDYISISNPNFIGGSEAVEAAVQQTKSSRVPLPFSRVKFGVIPVRHANGVDADQGVRATSDVEKAAT
ncbi:hypothetical protein VNO77_25723 [Canavalia gladiata]|uniref:Uncharacterized protein n=1 Tax=Canavalia gladiata TaxID=3824 RepID=A0AAN9KUS4_CANGL